MKPNASRKSFAFSRFGMYSAVNVLYSLPKDNAKNELLKFFDHDFNEHLKHVEGNFGNFEMKNVVFVPASAPHKAITVCQIQEKSTKDDINQYFKAN